jgi:hypothetical protein
MGMKNLLLKNMLLTFEFHNTVSGATDMEIVQVYVGLDDHSETIRVCVMDVEGETLVNRSVANDPAHCPTAHQAPGPIAAVSAQRPPVFRFCHLTSNSFS